MKTHGYKVHTILPCNRSKSFWFIFRHENIFENFLVHIGVSGSWGARSSEGGFEGTEYYQYNGVFGGLPPENFLKNGARIPSF